MNGSFLHIFNFSYGAVLSSICKLRIYFIRKNNNIRTSQDFSNFFKVLSCHNSAGRIVGERKNKNLCFISNLFLKSLCRKFKIILMLSAYRYRYTVHKLYNRGIAYKAGFNNKNLIPGINKCSDGYINSFRTAYCNNNFVIRII